MTKPVGLSERSDQAPQVWEIERDRHGVMCHPELEVGECRRVVDADSVGVLDAEEQQAMDDLLAVYNRILRWGLRANQTELTMAIHTIQGFVTQRMLHRLAPGRWGAWYEEIKD